MISGPLLVGPVNMLAAVAPVSPTVPFLEIKRLAFLAKKKYLYMSQSIFAPATRAITAFGCGRFFFAFAVILYQNPSSYKERTFFSGTKLDPVA